MSLSSLSYVLFLLASVCAYWFLPVKMQRYVLLTVSFAFYLWAMPGQLPFMLLYIWLIYLLAIQMVKKRRKYGKTLLRVGIAVSVLYLFVYKYLNFSLSFFTGERKSFSLVVPVGISYITFQCIAYLVNVYKNKMHAVNNASLFFLYCLFFPKVTAGPIEDPERFMKQFTKRRTLTWSRALSSVVLIALGFAKKIAVADLVAGAVNTVFASPARANGASALTAILLYSAQIYFDFSGYTDIALGSARLFGIQLTENFHHPYLATSVGDFWRRWHISLSEWLKQYIYIPLGGNRVGTLKRYRNILIVFLTSGIWHGASLTFIFWGLMHGLIQICEIALDKLFSRGKPNAPKKPKTGLSLYLSRIRTFALVSAAWVFFRAESIQSAFQVFGRLFTGWGNPFAALGLTPAMIAVALVAGIVSGPIKAGCQKQRFTRNSALLCCLVLTALVLLAKILTAGSGIANSFIYFDF